MAANQHSKKQQKVPSDGNGYKRLNPEVCL